MRANNYKDDCEGCNLSRERKKVVGGIVRLGGKWMLNHYQNREQGFLGWLALQPELHTEQWDDLEDEELQALGLNIKRIKQALRKCFPKDSIKRIYVVYFFDWHEQPSEYHLHIHLIPRFASLAPLLKDDRFPDINAWNIYTLASLENDFPEEYRWDDQRIDALMEKLRSLLSHTACPNMKEEKPESRLIFTLIMCLIYGGLAALIIGLILLLDWLTL